MIMAQSTAPTQAQAGELVRGPSELGARVKQIIGDVNVGQSERVISSVAGGALALAGIRMRSVPGALLAAVGGTMVFRGVTGHCPAYQSLGVSTADDRDSAAASPQD